MLIFQFFFNEADEENGEQYCFYIDEDNCKFAYAYAYNETGHIIVRAQEKLDCPPEVYILGKKSFTLV